MLQLKSNPTILLRSALDSKHKKRNIPIDREKLYSENLELKQKIQELMKRNTRIQYQLTKTEKEKIDICQIAE